MASVLAELQEWYASHCDGDWEHGYGIRIGTLDNPGWSLCINLEETELADVSFEELKEHYDDPLEWLICVKQGNEFHGHGGPCQLERIIQIFLTWAQDSRRL